MKGLAVVYATINVIVIMAIGLVCYNLWAAPPKTQEEEREVLLSPVAHPNEQVSEDEDRPLPPKVYRKSSSSPVEEEDTAPKVRVQQKEQKAESKAESKSKLHKQLVKWEETQHKLASEWREEMKLKKSPYYRQSTIRTMTTPEFMAKFPFKELPGEAGEGDYYNLNGYMFDPRTNGYIKGYNYDYITWLKNRGVKCWQYVMKKKCTPYVCHIVDAAWEEYDP